MASDPGGELVSGARRPVAQSVERQVEDALDPVGVGSADSRDPAGAASGLVNVAHQLHGSLGLGIMVTVAAASRSAADHPLAGASPRLEARHELAQAVATAVTGSAVFLALALAVVLVVMRRRVAERSVAVAQAELAR